MAARTSPRVRTLSVRERESRAAAVFVSRGVVTSAEAVSKKPGVARQTPRVTITLRRDALARRSLGRSELKPFGDWKDGRPETALNFKFYRQATDKIVCCPRRRPSFSRLFQASDASLKARGPDAALGPRAFRLALHPNDRGSATSRTRSPVIAAIPRDQRRDAGLDRVSGR